MPAARLRSIENDRRTTPSASAHIRTSVRPSPPPVTNRRQVCMPYGIENPQSSSGDFARWLTSMLRCASGDHCTARGANERAHGTGEVEIAREGAGAADPG